MSSIIGSVTLEGRPLGGAYVRLVGPSGEFVSEQYTKDDGRFTFHAVPGSWKLEARAAGGATLTDTIELSESDATITVDLKPAN